MKNTLTVAQLRAVIARLPDNMPVVITKENNDHTFRTINCAGRFTIASAKEYYAEWEGPENASSGETPVEALVLE